MDGFKRWRDRFLTSQNERFQKGTACHPIKSSAAGRRPAKLLVSVSVRESQRNTVPYFCFGWIFIEGWYKLRVLPVNVSIPAFLGAMDGIDSRGAEKV